MTAYLTLLVSPKPLWCLCLCFRCFLCLCLRCSLRDLCFLCFFFPSWVSSSLFFFIFFMCFLLRYSVPLVLLVSMFVSISASLAHSLVFTVDSPTLEHIAKLLLSATAFVGAAWLLAERFSSEEDICLRRCLPNERRGFGSYSVRWQRLINMIRVFTMDRTAARDMHNIWDTCLQEGN